MLKSVNKNHRIITQSCIIGCEMRPQQATKQNILTALSNFAMHRQSNKYFSVEFDQSKVDNPSISITHLSLVNEKLHFSIGKLVLVKMNQKA